MSDKRLTAEDYPVAEHRPDMVRGARGKGLDDVTLTTLHDGQSSMEDLRITPEALRQQAAISRDAGRPKLADNFERAAEMAMIPQDVIMSYYELLRPGRAKDQTGSAGCGGAVAQRLRRTPDGRLRRRSRRCL